MSLKEVTDRLHQTILEHNHGFSNVPVRELSACPGDETNDWHLLWMIQQIQTAEDMSLTKCCRWIGFIQGVLVSKGYTTVEEEKEATRGMYND